MPLYIVRKDITTMKVDAIVNTSNAEMVGYAGVDYLVHSKAGPMLDAYCQTITPLELGFAKITPGFDLPCKYIIHVSGPIWRGGEYGERALLKSCYREALDLAKGHKCKTVAFPLISSGSYGYPKNQVLKHAVETISDFLKDNDLTIYICVYDRTSYEFSKSLYADISTFIDQYQEVLIDKCMSFGAVAAYEDVICEAIEESHPQASTICENLVSGLKEFLEDIDAGFADSLFALIDAKGMTDVQCYKKANVDKKTFSKIKCDPKYRPSKRTAVAFAIALELDYEETQRLLATVGMALSRSNKFDLIIEYFIRNGVYNIHEINEALFEFDQLLLGC